MTIDGLERLGRLVYGDQFRTRHILEGPEDPLLHKVADMIEDLLAEQSELQSLLSGYCERNDRLYNLLSIAKEENETLKEGQQGPRFELQAFVRLMENTLRLHDHKKHWSRLSSDELAKKPREECVELISELTADNVDPERVLSEAVDVANVVMMIADTIGGFQTSATETKGNRNGV